MVHGVDKTKFQKFRSYEITEGDMDGFMSARDGALVGASIAKRKGWKAGQDIDLRDQLGILLSVKGIFVSGNEEQNNTIIADMEYVQDQYDHRGRANIFMVKLKPTAKAEDVAADVDAMPFPTGTNSQAEKAFVSGMIEDLGDMISLSRLVILITLLVVFLSVANTVSMSVRDRTRQIGMMRTLGFKRWMVLSIVVSEAA
ncbi:ABC transporter permease [Planctomycetota bacterium]|nr:ABC transporter permease [Planctomycetota bacterium]